jgi:hypothetical protein
MSRALRPRLTYATARVGARVVVVENDSMYRGAMGVIVERDVSRTARLNNFQRQMLNTGGVLVERNEGSLFVVPAHFLEIR